MPARTWLVPVLLVVAGVIAASAAGAFVYLHYRVTPAAAPRTVAEGSNVTVNYIGIFGSGPEQGRVFDTSIFGVANNSAQYPKGLEFHLRGPAANYTPLAVYVGASTPSGGYSLGGLNFIGVVPGFWQGIIGMQPNTTRTVVVPPSLGYGTTDPTCVRTEPIVTTLPVQETVPGVTFQKSFPGINAALGKEFTDPHYGWTDQVLNANASFVTIQRLPYVGEVTSPGGWPIQVTGISATANGSGTITLRNEIAPTQAGHLLGKDFLGTGPCSASSNGQFIVTAVDLTAGTFTENFNSEVQGQTLIFVITVVNYFPAGTVG